MLQSREYILNDILAALESQTSDSAILVKAPLGFGKTSLLREISRKVYNSDFVGALLSFDLGEISDINSLLYSLASSLKSDNKNFEPASFEIIEHINNSLENLYSADNELAIKLGLNLLFGLDSRALEFEFSDITANFPEENVQEILKSLYYSKELLTETLLIDLINYFNLDIDAEEIPAKKCAIMLVDLPKDKSKAFVNWFNNYLLKDIFERKFSKFQFYNIESARRTSDFIEFSFVFASSDYLDIDFEYSTFELPVFQEEDLRMVLEQSSIKSDRKTLLQVQEATQGIPLFVNFWIKQLSQENKVENYDFAKAELDTLKLASCVDIISLALFAYFESFNSYELRLFNQTRGQYKETYEKIKTSSEIVEKTSKRGFFKINESYRNLIKSIDIEECNKLKIEFQEIAPLYNSAIEIFQDLSFKKSEILRSLAYFDQFDLDYAVPETFQTNADDATTFIASHLNYFDIDKEKYSLKRNIKETLSDFNKVVDGAEKYDFKISMIKETWQKRENALRDELTSLVSKAGGYGKELGAINKKATEWSLRKEKLKTELIYVENSRITLNKRQKKYEAKTLKISLASAVASTILFIWLYIYSENFAKKSLFFRDNLDYIQVISAILFVVSLLISLSLTVNFVKVFAQKFEKNQVQEDIGVNNERIDKLYAEQDEIDEFFARIDDQKSEILKKINDLERRQARIQSELTSKYLF